jgi:hypothetical protein
MEAHHWLMIALVLAIGYVVGAKYPILMKQVGAY